ncbi:MAG TPA: FecR family protein, partial [Anaerolineales bacterium]|nr:FecR family protein [Anaerolineales bacterium]
MNTKPKYLLLLVALALIFASCKPKTTSPLLSASLSELTGKVDIKQAGTETFAPASADSPLEVNGQVQTGDDGRVRLDLSTGTIVRVAPSSLFTLTSNDEVEGGLATKIKLELGKIFIILNGGSADVETPSGVASVRGSYMHVEVDPETLNVYVTCLEGDCSAYNEAGGINFTQGEHTILFAKDPVTGEWTIPEIGPMTPEEFQEWSDVNPEAQDVMDLFNDAMATMTALAKPTSTSTPTSTPTLIAVIPPTDASSACFKIIKPGSGTTFTVNKGKVTFEWTSQDGADYYVVSISDSQGGTETLDTTETSMTKYIEIFPDGGSYEWSVTAYKENGEEICTTKSASFSKPEGDPTPEPEPTKEKEPEPEPTEPPYCDPCMEGSTCFDPYNE